MNYMEKVAEMLGVEFGEIFRLFDTSRKEEETGVFWINEDGMYKEYPDGSKARIAFNWDYILTGGYEIVKLPWKPKDGDHYWYVEYDEGCALCRTTWSDSSYDLALYKLGKLYRTKAEAEKHADEDAAYWESIREEIDG